MRRNKATPGAREEHHFLFEESVQEEETAGDGGTDWWRLLRGVGPIETSQECTMLLSSRTRDSVREEEKERKKKCTEEEEEEMEEIWDRSERRGCEGGERVRCGGQKQGKIAATYSRGPTTVDGQTDTHAGVLYLQSSVEGERWERDVIVITTTTTTREKGQSSCKEPHISQVQHRFGPPSRGGQGPNGACLKPGLSRGREVGGASD